MTTPIRTWLDNVMGVRIRVTMAPLKRSNMKRRERLLVLLLFMPFLSACEAGDKGGFPTLPVSLPFEVRKPEKIDAVVEVRKCAHYFLVLRFGFEENDRSDRARVRKLVGGYETDARGVVVEPGVPTPVRLRVFEIGTAGEKLVFEKEGSPILTSWGANNFGKRIGEVLLPPGIYRINLESLLDRPEYAGIPVHLTIGADPKALPNKGNC